MKIKQAIFDEPSQDEMNILLEYYHNSLYSIKAEIDKYDDPRIGRFSCFDSYA